MQILLAFAPFIAFVIVERLAGGLAGLIAGAAGSAALLAREWLSGKRAAKVLEIGTFILFGGLAAYALLTGVRWSIIGVRLRVDAGLLLIVLVSIAIRLPFTLQYAREQVAPEFWETPRFRHTNYVLTTAWAAAFAAMVTADLVMLYLPRVPMAVGVVVTVAALVGAYWFTDWYRTRVRRGVTGPLSKTP